MVIRIVCQRGGVCVTFEREDSRPRLVARCDPELVDRLDHYVTEHDTTKSAVIRSAVREYVEPPTTSEEIIPPTDSNELRRAYLALREGANPDGWIRQERAITMIAQETQQPKPVARNTIIRQLSSRGYVRRSSDQYGDHVAYEVLI